MTRIAELVSFEIIQLSNQNIILLLLLIASFCLFSNLALLHFSWRH